jgi:hypothetical protein
MARSHRFTIFFSFALPLLLVAGSAFAFPIPPVETFDEVTAPALPSGWIDTYAGVLSPGWITVANAFSSPNAAFTDDTFSPTDKSLETPPFHIFVANGQVTFQHKFDLEFNAPAEAYDGVALEIAYDNEAFVDIIAAGGSFASGGYNGTTPSTFGNPLAGRSVWSGTSPGYQGVVVNLPAAANDRTIRLRWRMGTDNSEGFTGYWLDDIHVYGAAAPTFPPRETFDEVAAPDLPLAWTNVFTGAGVGWITEAADATSAPNVAFADDTALTSDNSLVTPRFFDVVANGRVTFRHKVILETANDSKAKDAAVLEISIAGGPFEDILAAGGSFVRGGYDNVVSTCCFSPLAGRPTWSGTGPSYKTVVVNLPPAANGHDVNLRWRVVSDFFGGAAGGGYWLDDIHVQVDETIATFPPDETFDEVVAPELPFNWINDPTAGPGPGWLTVLGDDNSPNAAFTDDTAAVSDKSLETPPFQVVANGRVEFRHKIDLESGNEAFDGVVLEIAYDNGTFVDVVDAGGTFVTGGYDQQISALHNNPLAGRAAWSGTHDYQSVTVNLPADANGRSVRLRWRMGTDASLGRSGYWLDTVHVELNGVSPNDEIFVDSFECGPACQR